MSSRAPNVHSVHIYNEDSALISRLCAIVASSLEVGDCVLIVATAAHRDQLLSELRKGSLDVQAHSREGRFRMLDAKETLATFMVKGMPDRVRFMQSVGVLLDQARNLAESKHRGLTVFGEMVAVLWDAGNKEGALQLEALWNDALNDRAFHLHCAYPRSGFVNASDEAAVCGTHSQVVQ
jgi:hypothetical protein